MAEIRSGIAKNANSQVSNPVAVHYLRVANVQDGYLDLSDMSQLTVSREDIQRYAVLPGDMLMNEGGDLDKLGRGALWDGAFSPCVHQNHVFVVRAGRALVPSYLKAWTASSAARRYFLVAGKQTTNLASINKTSLGEMPVALPPSLDEQQAIAAALTDADALIESLEQLLAKKRQIKQGAMQELLTGQRRLPGFDGEWVLRRLDQLAAIQRGASPRPIDDPIWFDSNSDVGWVRISDLTRSGMYLRDTTQRLSELGVRHSRPVARGSLIMSICATVGRPAITDIDACIHDGFVVFDALSVHKHFLFYVLTAIEPLWAQHGQTGSQMNLNTPLINRTSVLLPPTAEEQKAVADALMEFDADIDQTETKLTKARHLKQAMMQALLTGRIRLAPPAAATAGGV